MTKIDGGMNEADVTTPPVKTKREEMLQQFCRGQAKVGCNIQY